MSEEPIAYTYDADLNADGAFLPGVPLGDLTVAAWDALPAWLQASVAALPCYHAVRREQKETTHDDGG